MNDCPFCGYKDKNVIEWNQDEDSGLEVRASYAEEIKAQLSE